MTGSGHATAWSSPSALWQVLAAQALIVALVLLIPGIGRRAPQLVNLGTRRLSDFSPEARARVLPLLEDMCGYMALLLSLLFTWLIRDLVRAALSPASPPRPWPPIVVFLAGTAVLVIYYLRRINQLWPASSGAQGTPAAT